MIRSDTYVTPLGGIVRRAPFAGSPTVGVRGLRTQQRILDAALAAFGEASYHGCSIDRITTLAGCSRPAFYQYFANKEAVFHALAGQVARQVSASTESLDPLTADPRGWTALRAWVARYAEIHARYAPVFQALETDDELAALARHTGDETIARINTRLATTTLPARQLDTVVRLLLECLNHTLDVGGLLGSTEPAAFPAERLEIAITDIVHRTLFGLHVDVNVHPLAQHEPAQYPVAALESRPETLDMIRRQGAAGRNGASAPGNRALDAVLTAGRRVFVERGYHNTRVDDLVAAAGVSRGAFYRCFRNKEDLARALTARAVRAVGTAVLDMPDLMALDGAPGRATLRRWLADYHDAHLHEAMMLRVWVDAALQHAALRAESAPLLDWGRRRMAHALRPRSFGDVEHEAIVFVALLGVFGARPRPTADLDAAARIIERGFLGRAEPAGSERQ
jgi:AcrR family transcriptional regulator